MFLSYFKSNLLLFFIVFLHFNVKSQNPTIKVYYSQIYPNLESHYDQAKSTYINYKASNPSIEFLPDFQLNISYYAFLNNDFEFALCIAESLIQNNGFHVSEPLGQYDKSYYYDLLKSKNIYQKFSIIQDSLLPIYYENNFKKLYVKEKINELVFKDILLTNTSFKIKDNTCLIDDYYNVILEQDIVSLDVIEKICKKEGEMINNVNHGVYTSEWVEFILLHVIKNPQNLERIRKFIHDYVEPTYLSGKIDYNIFKLFDKWENYHTGYQTYGTIRDVPFKNNKSELINYDFNFD